MYINNNTQKKIQKNTRSDKKNTKYWQYWPLLSAKNCFRQGFGAAAAVTQPHSQDCLWLVMSKLENSTLHSLHKSSFHPELGDNEANVTRCRIVATALWHVWRWSNAHCCQGIHSAQPRPRLRTIGYNFAMHLTLNVSWELSSHSTFLWYFTVARILAISFTINYYSQHISGIWRYAEHWPHSLSAVVLSNKHCWGLCVCV